MPRPFWTPPRRWTERAAPVAVISYAMKTMTQKLLTLILALNIGLQPVWLQAASNLPDIGSPADAILPKSQEAALGRSIIREIRRQGVIVNDPELTEYVQSIGHRLAAQVNNGDFEFEFFVVDNPQINAFALPGGYIGVHTGLIEASGNEDELAGVLAHEIAHVTQRHIARAVHANQRAGLLSLATMLGAIIAATAANAGGEGIEAAIMSSQALQAQNQINFTRSNEYEADRVGVGTMAAAGFNPGGMADFFATLSRGAGPAALRVPEFLRTHPVNSARIAESRGRARDYGIVETQNSTGYDLAKARLKARRFSDKAFTQPIGTSNGDFDRYAHALVLLGDLKHSEAKEIFADLVTRHPEIITYRIGLGQSLAGQDDHLGAIEILQAATELFPRNIPLSVAYGQVLIDAGRPDDAHRLLLDLFNTVPPTLDQVRLITRAAIEAGEVAEAHYYQSEYNIMLGDLVGSITMLRKALDLPELSAIQIARFEARIETVSEYLSDEQRRQLQMRKKRKARNG